MQRHEIIEKMFYHHELEVAAWSDKQRPLFLASAMKLGVEHYTQIAKLASDIRNGLVALSGEEV